MEVFNNKKQTQITTNEIVYLFLFNKCSAKRKIYLKKNNPKH